MKKILFTISLQLLLGLGLYSQIKVHSSGDVSLGVPITRMDFNVNIETNSDTKAIVYAQSYNDASMWVGNGYMAYGLGVETSSSNGFFYINANSPKKVAIIRNCPKYTIGLGFAGITDPNVDGDYYLHVNGPIKVQYCTEYSDIRLKNNIEDFSNPNRLLDLQAISYNFNNREDENEDYIDTVEYILQEGEFVRRKHYGFSAQDVQDIFPNLVYEGEDGYLALNYVEFVPMLVEAYKQQQSKIDELEQTINSCCSFESQNKSTNAIDNTLEQNTLKTSSYLEQNTPNPFTNETLIKYNVSGVNSDAQILVFDMTGKLLKSYKAMQGKNQLVIKKEDLIAGMYYYSLIIAGKEIDTKKMILID